MAGVDLKAQKAFTLIELMIALLIMGLLMRFAMASYDGYISKTRQLEAKELLARVINEQASFRVLCPVYATSLQSGNSLNRNCASRSLTVPFPLQSESYTLSMQAATANSFDVVIALRQNAQLNRSSACSRIVASWNRASIQYSGFEGECGGGVWQ
ncbi:MAG: type II secretion system protein [Limnobacter sp.]|uniref:type IV pilin protein n=1 Tax=Limnobacter sp. TaxID=2003368 RepID=UPI0022C0D9B6|nr:type II secretion system protein [Limnobacter sp.]MCZ8016601.1 type II secretion system protein [Limnobacter sp.]